MHELVGVNIMAVVFTMMSVSTKICEENSFHSSGLSLNGNVCVLSHNCTIHQVTDEEHVDIEDHVKTESSAQAVLSVPQVAVRVDDARDDPMTDERWDHLKLRRREVKRQDPLRRRGDDELLYAVLDDASTHLEVLGVFLVTRWLQCVHRAERHATHEHAHDGNHQEDDHG